MVSSLIQSLRPLIHPMVVHFPIALLYGSVALDWLGYWLQHPNLTRAGFYALVLGTAGAGIAALTGPDHVAGGADVAALLASHQSFALLTVALAVGLMTVRFLATNGIRDLWALVYLACTVPLLMAVSLTGYYGGELTYHHGVGIITPQGPPAALGPFVGAQVPTKPLVALLGLLVIAGVVVWLTLGRALAPAYFGAWWHALKIDRTDTAGALWTLRVGPSLANGRDQWHADRPALASREVPARDTLVRSDIEPPPGRADSQLPPRKSP
ncbi:MAG TPA: DUF2231 domain-containing protein [Ktedonobacterales bacterium]